MGNWMIVIEGTGPHHNSPGNDACDVERFAQSFADTLSSAGHTEVKVRGVAGGTLSLGLQAAPDASGENNASPEDNGAENVEGPAPV